MACRYIASVKVQPPRTEIIQDLAEMVNSAMDAYYWRNNKTTPGAIYFFRDGVSEGEFERVRQAELGAMKGKFSLNRAKVDWLLRYLLEGKYAALKLPRPPITFIIVGKRHHFRFFPEKRDEDRTGNCRSGLVVDQSFSSKEIVTTGITHPIYQDFYLQSQAGLKGTSVPSHYTIIEDENYGFSANHLQELAYSLCHCYSRATRAVKIPAPVYYADLVCRRAKFHYDPDMYEELSAQSETSDDGVHLDFYKKKFSPINERMKTYMYFL
ncbi:hypothetical protein V5O48_001972 [Marasmius crinis-equi]|uniref:Piwi domain-containing protein n=1 Tax=Marasmius crinis-equi TaxID=585013 RepID=A0ABR3FWZ9_9AGAR